MNENKDEKSVITNEDGIFLIILAFWLVMCLMGVLVLYCLPGMLK